jgi:hypothetical protein
MDVLIPESIIFAVLIACCRAVMPACARFPCQ